MSPRPARPLSMEHILLCLLDQKSMHGYELYQELGQNKAISMIWNIKQPMLYAILDKLEEQGYLTSHLVPIENHPNRKYFSVTEAGRDSLQIWLRTPVRRARNMRQEFLAKLIAARHYGDSTALELIQLQKQVCQIWLTEAQDAPRLTEPDTLDEWLIHSFRLQRATWLLKWLADCEQVIEQLPKDGDASDEA